MDESRLVELITRYVTEEMAKKDGVAKASYVNEVQKGSEVQKGNEAQKGNDPQEVVIGVGPAFLTGIRRTINGLPLEEVLKEIKAGIEEEGMRSRVVKVHKTSDVSFIGKEAARLSGSGISIGLQSKGTAIIHQKDLYPLTNLELFPQAPLMSPAHYRRVGKNAARYVKGENVLPMEVMNDPMVRASYQVKAALMHIRETQWITDRPTEEWVGVPL